MARISEKVFRNYTDGQDRMSAKEYMQDRETFRMAINDIEDRFLYVGVDQLKTLANDLNNINGKIEQNVQETKTLNAETSQQLQEVQATVEDLRQNGTGIDAQARKNVQAVTVQLAEIASQNFNIEQFREVGLSDTDIFVKAISTIPSNSVIKFDNNRIYTLSRIPKLEKAMIFDFNGATIVADTTGDLFTVGYAGETEGRIHFKNFIFKNKQGVLPNTFIKIDDAINTVIEGDFRYAKAAHSLVWNYKGYGTKIKGEMRRSDVPRCIYLSNDGMLIHSYAIDINIDITGNTGVGIEIEGGNGRIKGVIEGCVTGLKYNAVSNISSLSLSVYFEANSEQDMLLQDTTGSQATIFLNNSFFIRAGMTSRKAIVLGRRIYITSIANFFGQSGIYETQPGVSAASWYNGINNSFTSGGHTDFALNGTEISDSIFNVINKTLTYGNSTNDIQNSAAGLIPKKNNGKTLGEKERNWSEVWVGNLLQLPPVASTSRPTPTRGGAVVFDVNLGVPIYWTGAAWKRFDTNATV